MQETWVQPLGREDPLKKGKATHSGLKNSMDCRLPGFSGKNTGVGCHFLLQEIFPTQGLKLGLLHCRQMLYCLILEPPQKIKALTVSIVSPAICHEVMGPDAMILVF